MLPALPQQDALPPAAMPLATGAALVDAVQALSDGLLLMDREYRIVFANAQGRRISRFRPEDLHGPTHWELFPSTVGTEIERKYRRVMEERVVEELEVYYEPFAIWLKVRAFPAGSGMAVSYADITALKIATMESEHASRRMLEVMETTTDAVFAVNRNWTITYVNAAAERFVAAVGNVVGRGVFHAFPGIVYEGSPYVRHYFAAMNEGVSGAFEAAYGAPFHVEVEVKVQPSDEGIIIFIRDVTQQRADERALRDSEERYRVLAELGPQALWSSAPDGRITYANQRLLEYIGPIEIVEGEEWLRAVDAEDRGLVREHWQTSIHRGSPFEVQARLIRACDGAVRWWCLRALPVRDDNNTVTLWIGTATDIHDERLSRERLADERAESERRGRELQAIYDTAPVGLALFEPVEFRYLQVNRRQAETLGMPAEEILGKRITDVVMQKEVLQVFERVARGETVRDYTYATELRNRPGEKRFFNVNYSPVRSDTGEVRAISAAVLETTQQKRAEEALLQSEKLAAVGRLASSISHEINNPLEAVTNLIYLGLTDPSLSETGKSYLRLAQDELGRVSQIATHTLRFHRQSNSPDACTAAQLIDPVLVLYAGRLINSGVHVEASYSTARSVMCFENDIRQVLNNLIANAIDAMRNGGRLIIRAHNACDLRSDEPGVRLTIADTGHGMAPEIVQHIFEPFYTTKGLNGNGLGLWISKGIVERHQGQLRVRSRQATAADSKATHGTIFTLFLPFAAGA